MMATNIFPIQLRYQQLTAILEDAGGELSEEMEAAIAFTESEFEQAAEQVGLAILENNLDIDKLNKAIERLRKMQAAYEQRNKNLRDRLKHGMIQFGYKKLKGSLLTLSVTPSVAVQIVDETAVPREYGSVGKWVASKKLIGDAIKSGQTVPGAELVENQNLRIS